MVTATTGREMVKHQFLHLANLISSLTAGYQTPASYTNLNANQEPSTKQLHWWRQVCCGMILGSAKLAGYETNHTL
jgi:hypothetical protein